MAQKGQFGNVKVKALKNSGKAIDAKGLDALALRYVSRYATTRYKLASYLHRKLREKGGEDDLMMAMAERSK